MANRPLVDVPPWITAAQLRAYGDCTDCSDAQPVGDSIQVASNLLFDLSGRQFTSPITVTVRPPFGAFSRQSWVDRYQRGTEAGYGLQLDQHTPRSPFDGSAERGYAPMIALGGYPVDSIESVWIDGSQLPETSYQVIDFRYLLRTDGQGWPVWQDIAKDAHSQADTFEVTYSYGSGIPTDGIWACRVLACELLKLALPEGEDSRLPQRVQSLVRQGVSMAIIDVQEFIDNGKTGLQEVDYFIRRVNPNRLQERGQVFSPDMPKRERSVTWKAE